MKDQILINPAFGKVALPSVGWEFVPRQSLTDFQCSSAGSAAQRISKVSNQYQLCARLGNATFCALVLLFNQNVLEEIVMGFSEREITWADWSMEQEKQRKQMHDELLREQLNSPPYDFSWGTVTSVVDPHDSSARIILRYRSAATLTEEEAD
jgi:hypothetical protein